MTGKRETRQPGPPVGEGGLGALARTQIEAARQDPRLGRDGRSMVADFWDAIEEAERTRQISIMGLHELTRSLEHEEARLGASHDDEDLPRGAAAKLQAAWERGETAKAEIDNDHPQLNAQALISMLSALDALVESWVPAMRNMRARWLAERLLDVAESKVPAAADKLSPATREELLGAVHPIMKERLPRLGKMKGKGTARYEGLLAKEGLGAPADRPLPDDLDEALAEAGALRDVIVHRASRVDEKALKDAPSLEYQEGDLVRISRAGYRKYSAAINCYGREILFRAVRGWPEVDEAEDGPNLGSWHMNYRLGP